MLDIIAVILIIFAIILMLYSITERSIAFSLICAALWLFIGLFMLQGIEVPYQMFNATTGNIETGTHIIRENLEPLAYFFMLLGIIMFIITFTMGLEALADERLSRIK